MQRRTIDVPGARKANEIHVSVDRHLCLLSRAYYVKKFLQKRNRHRDYKHKCVFPVPDFPEQISL